MNIILMVLGGNQVELTDLIWLTDETWRVQQTLVLVRVQTQEWYEFTQTKTRTSAYQTY